MKKNKIKQGKSYCVICGKEITGFRDIQSEREYRISGLCQECQDKIWQKFN